MSISQQPPMQRHLVLVSWRSYPFGGGEQDLLDKARVATRAGWRVSWVSHATGQGEVTHTEREFMLENIRCIIQPPGHHVQNTVRGMRPSVVMVIGRMIADFVGFVGAPWIAVYHFWTHGVDMSNNVHILSQTVTESPVLAKVAASAARVCVVSDFMYRVFEQAGSTVFPTVLLSAPSVRMTTPYVASERSWVLVANAHPLKTGRAFLPNLIRKHPAVPVRAVFTEEFHDADYAAEVLRAVTSRNNGAPVELLSRAEDMEALYATTRIVYAASVVDETFGRVAAEAMQLGIPVALSRRGNLYYLGGEGAWYVDPDADPSDEVAQVWADEERLKRLSQHGLRMARAWAPEVVEPVFLTMLSDAAVPQDRPLIAFYAPWADQGLGTQTRSYARALEAIGTPTAVFSFAPYLVEGAPGRRVVQSDPCEWSHPRVHYSSHNREGVSDAELRSFVQKYRPAAMVIPETCWYRVFEIAAYVRTLGVRAVGIPNIELVRSDELSKHAHFDALLANNRQCEEVLRKELPPSSVVTYVGFALYPPLLRPAVSLPAAHTATLVVIGGGWLDGRKQGPAIVRAFSSARSTCRGVWRLRLVLTSQNEPPLTRALLGGDMELRVGNASLEDINQLYETSAAALLVSKHEGLGMNFYEAMQHGCPVVTVDAAPQNELVLQGVNGWLLPCDKMPVVENNASLVQSSIVHHDALLKWFLQANENVHALYSMRSRVLADYASRFDPDSFARRFEAAVIGRDTYQENGRRTYPTVISPATSSASDDSPTRHTSSAETSSSLRTQSPQSRKPWMLLGGRVIYMQRNEDAPRLKRRSRKR